MNERRTFSATVVYSVSEQRIRKTEKKSTRGHGVQWCRRTRRSEQLVLVLNDVIAVKTTSDLANVEISVVVD